MAIVLTVVFATVFALANFSDIGIAGLLKITGGANTLDFEFGYDSAKAQAMLDALGAEGRQFYLIKVLPMDFLFPITYMLCYASWLALLLNQLNWRNRLALLIPVLAMLFDWIENFGIIGLLHTYGDIQSLPVLVASTAGILKRIFTLSSIAAVLVLLIIVAFKHLRKRMQ